MICSGILSNEKFSISCRALHFHPPSLSLRGGEERGQRDGKGWLRKVRGQGFVGTMRKGYEEEEWGNSVCKWGAEEEGRRDGLDGEERGCVVGSEEERGGVKDGNRWIKETR